VVSTIFQLDETRAAGTTKEFGTAPPSTKVTLLIEATFAAVYAITASGALKSSFIKIGTGKRVLYFIDLFFAK
jgi:hypothetical protein